MSTPSQEVAKAQPKSLNELMKSDSVQRRFDELLGKKSAGFISSLLQIINGNNMLKNAVPATVLNAAATAAVLGLPINSNFGFAYIVPYNEYRMNPATGRKEKMPVAQFQMGYKGYIQLAQRSGQFKAINAGVVYVAQFKSWDKMTESLTIDDTVEDGGPVHGYFAHFKMLNGFTKMTYWSKAKVEAHAKKYSQSYRSGRGGSLWSDDDQYDTMALKTVIKDMLKKWAMLSIEIQTAVTADQSVQDEEGSYRYSDNAKEGHDIAKTDQRKQRERVADHIAAAATVDQLEQVRAHVDDCDLREEYDQRKREIMNEQIEDAHVFDEAPEQD